MTFFDKKSEVINIELTQYGKHLLSMGKFKPVYYEFFDNDVLYDSQYCGVIEERNNIQERIKNETPYMKPQYVFSGVETSFKKLLKEKQNLRQEMNERGLNFTESQMLQKIFSSQQAKEKIYFNSSPLGTSNIDEKIPAFRILTYETSISSSQQVKNLETQYIRTPEIIMNDSNFETFILPQNQELDNQEMKYEFSETYLDGTRIVLKKNSIILEIDELNTKEMGDNFEIEIYQISSSSTPGGIQEEYNKLYFSQNDQDPRTVEHYFEVNVDQDIEQNILNSIKSSPLFARIIQEINN
jgi:hypothetical protein